MAGVYVSMWQDFRAEGDEFGCVLDHAFDEIGAPSRANGRKGQTVIMARTHGCSCCSDTEEVTLEGIQRHIERLKEELQKAFQIEEALKNRALIGY